MNSAKHHARITAKGKPLEKQYLAGQGTTPGILCKVIKTNALHNIAIRKRIKTKD
jgi:hypothetical protein